VHAGPIVIGFDGSPAAQQAAQESGALLSGRRAVVVVVWKQGLGFELLALPTIVGLPPVELDTRTALEIDQQMYERAQQLAQQGAEIAREAGLEAGSLAVAEDPDVPIGDVLVRVARERDAAAVVVAPHGHGPVAQALPGRLSNDVMRSAACPVVVVRPHEH
jgi:nucleotide-binding universal stress UspA family protein